MISHPTITHLRTPRRRRSIWAALAASLWAHVKWGAVLALILATSAAMGYAILTLLWGGWAR